MRVTRRALLGVAGAGLVMTGCSSEPPRDPLRKVVKARDFDVIADGVHDSSPGLRAAVEASHGGRVDLDPGPHLITDPLVLLSGEIRGSGRGSGSTLIKGPGVSPIVIMPGAAQSARLRGLHMNARGLAPVMVQMQSGARDCHVTDCSGTDPAGTSLAVQMRSVTDCSVTGCSFSSVRDAIYVLGATRNVNVEDNQITQWRARAIYVSNGTDGSSRNVLVRGNRVTQYVAGIPPGHPITIQSTGPPHRSVSVNDNVVTGNDVSYTAEVPGTADQIWLSGVENFTIRGNTSTFGGDMGITVSGVARGGIIEDNVCTGNDVAGIDLGSSMSSEISDIVIRRNTCTENGRNRQGDRAVSTRTGIRLQRGCARILIEDNTLFLRPGTTQQSAISITDSTDLTVTGNQLGNYSTNPIQVGANVRGLRISP